MLQPSDLLPPHVVKGSLRADGSRDTVYPADVSGRFTTARKLVYLFLIGVGLALPWLRIGDNPAVLLDIEKRRFFLFGATFNAQDTWLLFFLLTGIGFGLIYATAWVGRAFCGWLCPQTVLLDVVYRRIERLVQGSRVARIRRNAGPWTAGRVTRVGITHAGYMLASFAIAHLVLAYFVSMPRLLEMVRSNPTRHVEAFAWAFAMTGILYFNFGFFREQLCLAICPYGRLQSVLIDADSITVGYDARRGEPRGKAVPNQEALAGDCVDCKRCIVVCPTGIDIRNGLQVDCIACTACIDACDDVMDRLHRPRGLIRYASTAALAGNKTRYWRPRVVMYTGMLVAGLLVADLASVHHEQFEANLLRLPGPPYVFDGPDVRDGFEIHLVNKSNRAQTYSIRAEGDAPDASFVVAVSTVRVGPLEGTRVPVLVSLPRSEYRGDFAIRVHVQPVEAALPEHIATGRFLGAGGA